MILIGRGLDFRSIGAPEGAEDAEAWRSVARIRLDTEMWPKAREQREGRGQTERDPKGEEDSERKNRYLGQV